MHLPDMPKRLVPFPLVLVAITGAFILIALYADVRGRERRINNEQPETAAIVNEPIVAAPEPTAATSTDAQPESQEPEPLGLPPETPTSNIPATAVFDCWRYEWRGDRLIVDRDYRHVAGDGIEPMVGPDTVHLRCKDPQYTLRSDDGSTTVYWSGTRSEQDRPASIYDNTLYQVDPLSGELTLIAVPTGIDAYADYALAAFLDDGSVLLRADSSKHYVSTMYRVTPEGDVRTYFYREVTSALEITPDQSRAVGFEYTIYGEAVGGPVYLHRINLATGAEVRTKAVNGVFDRPIPETSWRPVFIDDQRLIMPGAPDAEGVARGATVVNIFTGATARVPQLTGTVELFGLTQDRSTFFAFSDEMPLSAIPVSELPKP